ncbi:Mbeg1-like protein [Aquibacillus kalidii]|uniref:Mbeg1-like protein n=1 Tax=Aquibacillus kalidii TaxID=2762597 RepID=UPI001645799C|nr:Mbeg1-like protein [Aquibacillus kalidii]
MSLNVLNDEEKNVLLQLSYFDIPPRSAPHGISLIEFWKTVMRDPKNGGEARRAALSEFFNDPEKYENSNLADVKLKDYTNNNPNMDGESESGFVGYAWEDNQGNAATVFRGSEDMMDPEHFKTDWVSNMEAGIGVQIQQQREADQFYRNTVKEMGGEILILGHSKGGNLASYVFVNNLEDKMSAYVINGAPIFWPDLNAEQKEALKSDRFSFIAYEGDFVHELGFAPYVDLKVKIKQEKTSDPFYPHYETSVNFIDGGFEETKSGEIDTYTEFLTNGVQFSIVQKVNQLQPEIQLAYMIKDATIIFIHLVKKGLEVLAKQIADLTVGVYMKVKGVTTLVINELKNFFDSLKQKVRSIVVKGLIRAFGAGFPVQPYLKVDLARLKYYESRLEYIKRKTKRINNRIDSLYWKADLFDLDNIIRADLLTTFHNRINNNIRYLNTTFELIQRTETFLNKKAMAIQ